MYRYLTVTTDITQSKLFFFLLLEYKQNESSMIDFFSGLDFAARAMRLYEYVLIGWKLQEAIQTSTNLPNQYLIINRYE